MMLALATAVISAKAASVDWAVTGTAAQKGYTVYLLASAPGDYADVGALASAAVGSATINQVGRLYWTGDQQVVGDAVTKDAAYYFAIVSGADTTSFNYIEATGMGNLVYYPNNQESSPGTFNTLSAANILAGTSKNFGGGSVTPSEPIPEPTSGLLLVVGGVLLALRRRQK